MMTLAGIELEEALAQHKESCPGNYAILMEQMEHIGNLVIWHTGCIMRLKALDMDTIDFVWCATDRNGKEHWVGNMIGWTPLKGFIPDESYTYHEYWHDNTGRFYGAGPAYMHRKFKFKKNV